MGVTISPVRTRSDLMRFVRLQREFYKDDPAFIMPLGRERLDHFSKDKNPFFAHAEARYWIASRDGRDVGRISAQDCELVARYRDPAIGQIGSFECENDPETAGKLFRAAEDWLASRGKTRIEGPFTLSINEESGLLIKGFDRPPSMMMGHARPWYANLWEGAGYTKAKDLYAYWFYVPGGVGERAERIVSIAENHPKIELLTVDKKKFEEETDTLFDIFNDAWSDNWGFIPFTDAEAHHVAKAMKLLIRKGFVKIACYEDEPVAFMVTLPDAYRFIEDLDGRLFPFGWAKLAWRVLFAPPRIVRVPLMGVRKRMKKGRLGGVLALYLIESIREHVETKGTEYGELSWILEDNTAMSNILRDIGAKHDKTYRIYEKRLG